MPDQHKRLKSVASFLIPVPIKATVLPLAQIVAGLATDTYTKRKAVTAFLKANPTITRTNARKIVLEGGTKAGTLLSKEVERPVCAYTISQLYETMMNDGAVTSSANPAANTYEFVSNTTNGVIDLLKGVPPRNPAVDRITPEMKKPFDLTFGLIDGKTLYDNCEGMTGKVFSIALNEVTYYQLCRYIRLVVHFGFSLLIVFIIYLVYRFIRYCNYRYRLAREAAALNQNLVTIDVPSSDRRLRLPPRNMPD